MRLRIGLLLLFGVAAAVHVCGVLFGSSSLTWEGGLFAAAALAGYVLVAGRVAPPRVRWFMVAAAAALGAVMVVPALPFGSPETVSIISDSPPGVVPPVLRETVDRSLVVHRWLGAGLLVTAGCLAAAVSGLPARRGMRRAVVVAVAVIGVLLALVLLAGSAWDSATEAGAADVFRAGWGPFLAAVAATVAAVLGAQRAGWLAAAGGLLLASVCLVVAANAVDTLSVLSFSSRYGDRSGILYQASSVAVSYQATDTGAAMLAAATLAGPLLFALACLRGHRPPSQPHVMPE